MKKLYMLTGIILFMMLNNNCMAIGHGDQQNNMKYWSEDAEIRKIQELVHNKHENDKFEVIHKPIQIDKLAEIVLSFLNAEENTEKSPGYIIIGIAEDLYTYKKISKTNFESSDNKEDGIYRVEDNDENINYYQIINSKKSELKLKTSKKNFLAKKLFKMESGIELTFREWNDIFYGVNRNNKPVNTNIISNTEESIVINVDVDSKKRLVKFDNSESYIQHLKKYIRNNTGPQIDFDEYIKVNYIKIDGINKIIILTIKPNETSIVQNSKNLLFYGRYNNNGNYGSNLMTSIQIQNMELKRYYNQMKDTLLAYNNTTVDSPEIKKLFDYIYLGDMDKFKTELLEQQNLNLEAIKDSGGNNALMIAAHCGQILFVEAFLKDNSRFKFDPYQLNNRHENVLLVAVTNNRKDIVELLLKLHPELFKGVNRFGSNAFLISCKRGNFEITEYLLKNIDPKMLTKTDLEKGLDIINKSQETKKDSEQLDTIKQLINSLINPEL